MFQDLAQKKSFVLRHMIIQSICLNIPAYTQNQDTFLIDLSDEIEVL